MTTHLRSRFALGSLALAALFMLASPAASQRQKPLGKAYVETLLLDDTLVTKGSLGGLCVDDTGTLFVANFRAALWRVSPWGEVKLLDNSFAATSGNCIAPDGTLLQSDFGANRVYSVHKHTGKRTLVVNQGLNGPVGVAVAPTGEIYVANCLGNRIKRAIPPSKAATLFATSPLLNCPNGLVVGPGGDLFVLNFGDDNLLRIDPAGNVSLFATLGSQSLGGGHIARVGDVLYVTMFSSHDIWRVTMSGEAELVVGMEAEPGLVDGTASRARLRFPNGIAADPSGRMLYTNNLKGPRNTALPGEMLIRRILIP